MPSQRFADLPPCPPLPKLPLPPRESPVYYTYRLRRSSRTPGRPKPKPKSILKKPTPQPPAAIPVEPKHVAWPKFEEKPKPKPPVVKLPEGYAFIPPPQPLNYPATYHLISAGPQNAPQKPKRAIFGSLTNLAARKRAAKEQKQRKAELADESFCCRGGEML